MKKIVFIAGLSTLYTASYAQDTLVQPKYEPVKGKLGDDLVLSAVEQFPEFPGGMKALMEYLSTNIHYPKAARDSLVTGKVVVKFVVCQDGSLCNETIVRPIGGGCDEEVLRVVKAMPKWKPGVQDGKPVKVYYTLPVKFSLQDAAPREQDNKTKE